MQNIKSIYNTFFYLVSVLLLVGCTSIPERKPNQIKHQKEATPRNPSPSLAIDSNYQTKATAAFKAKEKGEIKQYVVLLERGDDALLARIHLIRSAQHQIDLQTFIWSNSPSSRFIFDELVAAAQRGVKVRLLIDALNAPGTPEELTKMAYAHKNIDICLYKPLSDTIERGGLDAWDQFLFKARHLNRRMHNKLLLIDSRIGIVGGRNYDDRYFDRDPFFLFRDRDILVAGPVAEEMQHSFNIFWKNKRSIFITQFTDIKAPQKNDPLPTIPFLAASDTHLFKEINQQANQYDLSILRPPLKIYTVNFVKFAYDTPAKFKGKKSGMMFDQLLDQILKNAQKQIVYQTPYLIYSRDTRRIFNKLKKNNPDFRIIASSNSLAAADHLSVYALSYKHRKELYKKSGIDIYEAKPYPADKEHYVYQYAKLPSPAGPRLCIHAKSFVVDREILLIGSHNFDPRSAKLNTECGIFIRDTELAGILEDRILKACTPRNAWTVSKAATIPGISHFSGFVGGISTALPFMDIWPFRYTTNYELREDAIPLLPRDPQFLENYINVGYFPEVPNSSTVINTRLMKAFGGWARPMM